MDELNSKSNHFTPDLPIHLGQAENGITKIDYHRYPARAILFYCFSLSICVFSYILYVVVVSLCIGNLAQGVSRGFCSTREAD